MFALLHLHLKPQKCNESLLILINRAYRKKKLFESIMNSSIESELNHENQQRTKRQNDMSIWHILLYSVEQKYGITVISQ